MSNYKLPRFDVNSNLNPVHDEWEWQYQGACRNADPELFFLEYKMRGATKRKREKEALAFCSNCPVINECREHSLKVPEIYGVWGGLTEEQRRRILQKRGYRFEHL